MLFQAEIIKQVSLDPYFKIVFSYKNSNVHIETGYAEVIREAPTPKIYFDADTEALLNEGDRAKLQLEILNKVVEYILSDGVRRSWQGKILMNAIS